MWPSPCATDYKGPGKTPRDRLDYAVERGATKSAVYPTPRALSLCGGSGSYQQIKSNQNLTADEKRALIASAGRGNKYDTPTVHGDGGSGGKGTMPKYGQLNPDWEEWLMAWPIGWTDLDTPNYRLVWYHPTFDPAAVTCEASASLPFIPRLTTRRKYRAARVKAIGNGQYPPTAFIMAEWGFEFLQLLNRSQNENR